MAIVAMSGNDTIIINGGNSSYLFTSQADGNIVELTYPNEIAAVKTGKNGNSIYGLNESGRQCEVKVRVLRHSADDKFMQELLNLQLANFAGFPLMTAEFTKLIGDGKGTVGSDIYILSGGIFTKQVEGKSNVEGDTEQSVAIYMMKFSNSPRALT